MGNWQHLHYAFRGLLKAKGFVATVVFTLSVTVAALLTVVAVNSAVYLKPLPYPHEDRIFVANQVSNLGDYETRSAQSTNTLNLWYRSQRSFEAFTAVYSADVFLEDVAGQPLLPASYVLPEYFDILGAEIVKGRAFTEEDEGLNAKNDNIIISETIWQRYFGGRADIIGSTVNMFGRPWHIVGVVAGDFKEPNFLGGTAVGVWLPWNMIAGQLSWEMTYNDRRALGLLKPGLTAVDAERELTGILQNVKDEWKGEWELVHDLSADVLLLRDVELGDLRMMSLLLLAGTLALLLIAIINTSNLFFTRVVEKNRTLALHAILGAKRRDLFINQFMESLLICTFAVIIGALLAAGMLQLLPFISQGRMPLLDEIGIDWVVLSCAVLLAIGIALTFSLITSRLLDFYNLKESVQSSGKGSAKSVSQSKLKLLVAAQTAMTTVVVLGASLFLAKAISVKSHDLGANIKELYNFHAFAGMQPVEPGRQETLEAQIREVMLSEPDIEEVSFSRVGPFRKDQFTMELRTVDNQSLGFFSANWVDKSYLNTSEIELLTGRNFTETSDREGQYEIIISHAVALKLGGDHQALGKTLLDFEDKAYQIVGVTRDGYHPTYFDEDKGARVYFPKTAFGFPLTVRMRPGTVLDKDIANGILKKVDSSLFIYEFHDIELEYQQLVHRETLLITFIGSLIFLTLLLCGTGIFGVISYNINLRRYEIGIRIAVGASRKSIYVGSIASVGPAFAGGILVACILTILCVYSLLSQTQGFILVSPEVIVVSLLAIVSVGLAAILLPTQKLVSSNPLAALKSE